MYSPVLGSVANAVRPESPSRDFADLLPDRSLSIVKNLDTFTDSEPSSGAKARPSTRFSRFPALCRILTLSIPWALQRFGTLGGFRAASPWHLCPAGHGLTKTLRLLIVRGGGGLEGSGCGSVFEAGDVAGKIERRSQ